MLARANAFADIERRLTFPEAKLDVKVENGVLVDHHRQVRPQRALWKATPMAIAFGWFFEDNYFDLLPGEVKTVRILGQHAAGAGSLLGRGIRPTRRPLIGQERESRTYEHTSNKLTSNQESI